MAVEFSRCPELRGVAFVRAWNAIKHGSLDKVRRKLSVEDFKLIFDQVVPVVAMTMADELRSRAQSASEEANAHDREDYNRAMCSNRAFGLHGAELAIRDAFSPKPAKV